MQRIDDPSAAAALPAPEAAGTPGYWTEGNPATGVPATLERASWFNMVQEELMNILAAAAVAPSKTTYNQVLTAIQTIVKQAQGNFPVASILTANTVLAAVDAGKFLTLAGAGFTLTLPPLASVPVGAAFAMQNGAGPWTAVPSGTDKFAFNSGTPQSSIALGSGDSLVVVSDGSYWRTTGGSAALPYAPGFLSSKATSGYQKLPSGLIIQWAAGAIATGQTIALPIAFPNNMISGMAGVANGAAWLISNSATAPAIGHNASGTQSAAVWAIGY